MSKTLLSLPWLPVAAGLLLTGCQPAGPPAATSEAAAATTAPAAVVRPRWPATLHLPPAGPGDTLTAAARTFLYAYDLAPLWANADYDQPADRAMEGFYGPDYHRIAFCFDEVRRDLRRPELFWVRGRNRYRKIITPFAGTITVRAIFLAAPDQPNCPASADTVWAYAVRAAYELREDPDTKGAGVYRGEALLDTYETPRQGLHQGDLGTVGYYQNPNPNQGGGLTFSGTWTDNKTGRRRFAAWSPNLQRVTPVTILEEQQAGGRTGDVDPVLAKHGWNELWDNDEWWSAGAPTAQH